MYGAFVSTMGRAKNHNESIENEQFNPVWQSLISIKHTPIRMTLHPGWVLNYVGKNENQWSYYYKQCCLGTESTKGDKPKHKPDGYEEAKALADAIYEEKQQANELHHISTD